MRISIKYKLLLAFFVTTTLVAGSMLMLMHWSFDRGFLQYVNTIELEAHGNLVAELSDIYKNEGDWKSLHRDKRRWHDLHVSSFIKIPRVRERLETTRERLESEKSEARSEARPPETEYERRERSFFKDRYRFRHSRKARHFKPRTALLDEDKQIVVGHVENLNGAELRPITVEDRLVGYLAIPPRKKLSDTHDLSFSKEVGRSFVLIALLTIAVATIVALPVSRKLVKPVKSLTEATRKLAAGDYSTRIPVGSNDELGQLSQDFNMLAKSLEQNEKARRQWIADISHELRTPLAVLRGEIEALQDGIRQPTAGRLASLHNEVMNLNRLIEDLYELSMSDIGALSYQKRDVELVELINTAVDTFREEFAGEGISLNFNPSGADSVIVFADPERLQQLFSNLLTNSLRYTEADGELQITLVQDRNNLTIEFSDSAPGVLPEELPKLFDRLYRVDTSRSRDTGGAGLGLSICRNIVEAHDGTITAENSPLGGILIKIELPVRHV